MQQHDEESSGQNSHIQGRPASSLIAVSTSQDSLFITTKTTAEPWSTIFYYGDLLADFEEFVYISIEDMASFEKPKKRSITIDGSINCHVKSSSSY
jgi:hypothetical protein